MEILLGLAALGLFVCLLPAIIYLAFIGACAIAVIAVAGMVLGIVGAAPGFTGLGLLAVFIIAGVREWRYQRITFRRPSNRGWRHAFAIPARKPTDG